MAKSQNGRRVSGLGEGVHTDAVLTPPEQATPAVCAAILQEAFGFAATGFAPPAGCFVKRVGDSVA